jgi:integrase
LKIKGFGRTYGRGAIWWIQFSVRGEVFRESSHSTDERQADKLLKLRFAETQKGQVVGPKAERVTLKEMAEALFADYKVKENRSLVSVELSSRHLIADFGENTRALDITKDRIDQYIAQRQQAEAANGSINREIAALRRMFNLLVQAKRLSHDNVPFFPHLKEAEPRQGFLEPAEFSRLRDALPDYLKDSVEFLYLTGWRKGAMRSLEWTDCELEFIEGELTGGTINLRASKSKNKRPSKVRLSSELLDLFQRVWAKRIPECPYVFHDGAGRSIGDFKKSWKSAKRAVGLDSVLVHDMRRSCARNLDRAGVSQTVAMRITGHLTDSMWRRYNIVGDDDLEVAMARVSDYNKQRAGETPKIVPIKRKVA